MAAHVDVPIDYVRVLIAGIAVHLLGAVVYSFSGLGKRWYEGHLHTHVSASGSGNGTDTPSKNTRSKGKGEQAKVKQGHPAFVMVTSFLMGLLTAFVGAHVLVFVEHYFKDKGVLFAMQCGLWNFIGFDLTYTLFNAVWLNTATFSVGLDLFYHFAKQMVIYIVLSAPSPF